MILTKGYSSWVRCWEMSKMGSGNWRLNRYCFFKVTKFNGRYRSMHWSDGI
jgi:hypothetical protein